MLEETASIYILTVNKIIENKTKNNVELPKSTTEITSNLPSCLKNQIIVEIPFHLIIQESPTSVMWSVNYSVSYKAF